MSDNIAPQLREDVLERLRAVAATRNFTKTPEEIERLIWERARGVEKSYLDLLSRVLSPVTSANVSSAPVIQPMPMGGGSINQQPQMSTLHMSTTQRPISTLMQPQQRPQYPASVSLPVTIQTGLQPNQVALHRPRMQSVVSQPNLVQHMQQMYPVSGVPSGQPAIVCSANRPASASLVPQGTTISGHLQTPLIMYQQVNPDKTVNRQTAVQAQPGSMAGAQILHHRADGCGRS
ncbi:hypothetical protein EG68_09769 [Paragonimus skrjabini miyazakii]|uniref:Uncharacterized protein n=1 Tax=Paragonimus skrjabini miyazakii TaxID=59628 RepID=A0A8S9YGY6_9TREM|nr:hypothetical protein EG68_09769 [Paragonimus skrjabini miyazakii]